MTRTCRGLALRLYDTIRNFRSFAFYTLPQFEKLESESKIPESLRAGVRELASLHRNSPELSDLGHISEMIKEVYRIAEVDNCEEELRAMVAREEKTLAAVFIYLGKHHSFNKDSTREYNYTPESHEEKYNKSLANFNGFAKDLGLALPSC